MALPAGLPYTLVSNVKHIFTPISVGVIAARHLAWYVSYQVTGEPRRS